MSKFHKKINEWVEQDLIKKDQAKAILAYEHTQHPSKMIKSFIILGVMVIGIGVISLVAYNWTKISGSMKLIIDFVLLSGLMTGCYLCLKFARHALFEKLLLRSLL